MRTLASALIGLGWLLCNCGSADAQSLLQRLEQRLNQLNLPAASGAAEAEAPGTKTPQQSGPAGDAQGQAAEAQPPQRGYLGLIADDAEDAGRGVRVLTVKPRGAAEAAGLLEGDLITAIDGQRVARLSEMAAVLRTATAGQRLTFQVERQGERRELAVVLAAADEGPLPAPAAPPPVAPPPVAPPPVDTVQRPPGDLEAELSGPVAARPSLGVTVVEVSDAARQRYGLNVARGALITSIRAGSPADRAGLPLGAVIVAVDGRRVDSPADLAELVGQVEAASPVEVAYYQADRLIRKRVDLTPVANLSPPGLPHLEPAEEPALRLGGGLADRPLLGRLEQALGGLMRPQEGEPGGPAGPASPRSEVDQLRAEVEALRRHITRLEQRLGDLEQRLPGGK